MPTVYDYRQYFPWMAEGGSVARPLPDRLTDAINLKDHARGDGVADAPGAINFITKLTSGYTGATANISHTSRAGYVPGGLFDTAPVTAGNFVIGQAYTITTIGNTNFTKVGALTNTVGTSFTALSAGIGTGTATVRIRGVRLVYGEDEDIVSADSFVFDDIYQIVTVGSTNFVSIGSPNNEVGTMFRATGVGTGSGTARPVELLGIPGYSVYGNGFTSQIKDIAIEVDASRSSVQNVHLIGSGIGAGLDIRGGLNYFRNVDVDSYDIGIANVTSFFPGGFAANNQVNSGWLWRNRIGVLAAQNDLRLNFVRISEAKECGIDFYDGGGLHFVGNHVTTTNGPTIRLRGKRVDFTGDIVAGSNTISNISDFNGIAIHDNISTDNQAVMDKRTRVTAINKGAGTLTIDPPPFLSLASAPINIRYAPAESFYVNNTFNGGGFGFCEATPGVTPIQYRMLFNIVSISSANGDASIMIRIDKPHWGIMKNDVAVDIVQTSNTAYNNIQANSVWIEALPSNGIDIQVNLPYVGPSTGGYFRARGFDYQVTTDGSNHWVADQFNIGGNHNRNIFQGGANLSYIGTRMNSKIYFDGCRPFFGTRTLGSAEITDIDIPTVEIRLGLPIHGGGIPPGSVVVSKTATSITIDHPATANSSAKIHSNYQTNYWFHLGMLTAGLNEEAADVPYPRGPGSLVGWSQIGMIPIGAAAYEANEGSFYTGARCAWTQGGMENFEAREHNFYGIMNTGFRFRTCGVQYDWQGNSIHSNTGIFNFEEGNYGEENTGVTFLPTGKNVYTTTRAYRSSIGDVWGNAVHRWSAPRNDTNPSDSAVGGAIVLPANNDDIQSNLFMVAFNNNSDLGGDRASIRGLMSSIELTSGAVLSGWRTGAEWLHLAGFGGNSYINVSQPAATRFFVSNPSTDPGALAAIGVRQSSTAAATGVRIEVYGTGYVSTDASLADGGAIFSDTQLSGGLTMGALAGDMRFFVGGASLSNMALTIQGANQRATFSEMVVWKPIQLITGELAVNGQFTIEATSNSAVKLVYKGIDGTLRKSAPIALSP